MIYYVRDGVPEENKVEKRPNKNVFELAEDSAAWWTVRFGVNVKILLVISGVQEFSKNVGPTSLF